MLADTDAVDEHAWIAARVETVGQAAAREVPLLNPLPGNAFRAAAALPCRVDATGEDRGGPAAVLLGAGPALRPPGAGSRWALTGSTSGMTGFLVARHNPITAQGAARTWSWTTTWRCTSPTDCRGALAGATALVSARATDVFTDRHQLFWDTARRKAGDRDGTKALIGVLLAAPHPAPPEAVLAGIDAAVATAGPVRSRPWSRSRCPSTPGPWAARRGGPGRAGDGRGR